MKHPHGRGKGSPYHQPLGVRILLFPLGLLYKLWNRSIRLVYQSENGRKQLQELKEPMVLILWHNRLFLAGEWHRRFRPKHSCYGLISGSKDGAWLETFYGWAGILAVRGSRNRRGTEATRELIRKLKAGNDVGITPDGSRGPKYKAKSGALLVARASKSPVVLLTFSYSSAIRLKSWDSFVIPLPFSRIEVNTQILFPNDLFTNHDLDHATALVERTLGEMTNDHA